MAAILCKGLCDICSGLGSALSELACLPCKACGLACNTFGDLLKTPFLPYLALSFILNAPGVYYGILSIFLDCPDLTWYLLGNGAFCVAQMLGAWYIVQQIQAPNQDLPHQVAPKNNQDPEAPTTSYMNAISLPKSSLQGAPNSMQRIKNILCHDVGVAVYLLVFFSWQFWVFCTAIGGVNANGDNCDEERHYLKVVHGCAMSYMSMVVFAFLISLCCLR
eukprot:Nitzschia sp. Nitz4//scaffold13_size275219//216006//216665//NITZ4_000907-RA/size275219-processed-gene-0.161-mRNA-1//-1//CDS//3329536113//850//frame0